MRYGSRAMVLLFVLTLSAGLGAQTETPAPPAAAEKPANPVVLTVNGEEVRAAEVSLVMQSVASRARQSGAQLTEEQLIEAGTRQVVETKLLAQEARRRDIAEGSERIAATMGRIEEQAGGRAALEAALAQGGMTYDQFRVGVAENDLVTQLITNQIRPTVQVTDQEVADFYTGHPEAFQSPEKVHARHILITASPSASDEEKAAARAKAEAARERVVKGEDFAAVAKEVSQCPSASSGGDLGFFVAADMVKPFADAAFGLKDGELSPVVETQFGYHVITSEGRQPASSKTLDEVKDQVRAMLERQKLSDAIGALLGKLHAEAKIVEAPGHTPSPS